MAAKERLPWYAQRFEAVELNSSFYAVPDRSTVHKWVNDTPEGFVFDVKAHRALSRHAAPLESLPPDLRDGAETNARGRVRLTPELEAALVERLVEETAPLAEAGKLGAYLVQLTPAFAPHRHQLEELDRLVEGFAPHRLAIELRHRGWVRDKRREQTLSWFADRGVTFVSVDAPPGDDVPIMPSLDAVTTDTLAYLRAARAQHRGLPDGQDRRRALRLALRRRRARGDRRARTVAGAGGTRGARRPSTTTAATTCPRRPSAFDRCSGRPHRRRSS